MRDARAFNVDVSCTLQFNISVQPSLSHAGFGNARPLLRALPNSHEFVETATDSRYEAPEFRGLMHSIAPSRKEPRVFAEELGLRCRAIVRDT